MEYEAAIKKNRDSVWDDKKFWRWIVAIITQ